MDMKPFSIAIDVFVY